MEWICYLTLLIVATFTRGNDLGMSREDERDNDNDDRDENISIGESFGAPVYSPSNIYGPGGLGEKSAYNSPPAPALPSSYAAYLTSLGYGNTYAYGPYSRYSMMPYIAPSTYPYGPYGALLSNPGFVSALLSGLGYAGYGSPYFGGSTYPGYGYGYPGFLSGLGYPPATLRRGPAPVAGAPVGIASPVARAAATTSVPAPVSPFSNAISGVPAPVPAVLPYRVPYRSVQNKDGSVRYVPVDVQNLYQ